QEVVGAAAAADVEADGAAPAGVGVDGGAAVEQLLEGAAHALDGDRVAVGGGGGLELGEFPARDAAVGAHHEGVALGVYRPGGARDVGGLGGVSGLGELSGAVGGELRHGTGLADSLRSLLCRDVDDRGFGFGVVVPPGGRGGAEG